tara:strand:- start:7942 stop:8688 length:747 start_codon:yes stop_codon:yes gene_type:complete
MSFEPKISLFTSVYKADQFIAHFLDDISKQTIFNECELILINANSPDNEEDVIFPFMEKHKNVVYKRLPEDPGVYAVWNIGVKMAKSKLLSNANVDDRKHETHLEKHYNLLKQNENLDLAYADVHMSCEPNESFEQATVISTYNFPEYSFLNLIKYNMPHNNPVWRSRIHEENGYFKEDMVSAADFDMWLRAACNGSQFGRINEVLGVYYKNPNGISTKSETLQEAIAEVNRLREDYMKKVDYREFLK